MKSNKNAARGNMLTPDKAMEIINNVSEAYIDLGSTKFATKEELCEAIYWLSQSSLREQERLRGMIENIGFACLKEILPKGNCATVHTTTTTVPDL